MLLPANSAVQQFVESARAAVPKPQLAEANLGEEKDFGKMLMDVMKEVNKSQMDAKSLSEDYMTNRRPVEVHELMMKVEQASTQMQLTMAVRNKVLEAYQEISRLQV